MERRRETSEITIIDNNVEMDDNDDDYENNERLNKIPTYIHWIDINIFF